VRTMHGGGHARTASTLSASMATLRSEMTWLRYATVVAPNEHLFHLTASWCSVRSAYHLAVSMDSSISAQEGCSSRADEVGRCTTRSGQLESPQRFKCLHGTSLRKGR
jgi:hypothetical protein